MKHSLKSSLTWSQKSSIAVICGYQYIRPIMSRVLFSVFGYVSECKHSPTCSEYTIAQIRSHGTIAGILRGGKRILTCW